MNNPDLKGILAIQRPLRRHRTRLVLSMLLRQIAVLSIIALGLLTIIQCIFAVFPWTALPMAWDAVVALFCALVVVAAIDTFIVRKPPLLSVAGKLEKLLSLRPRWISLALELSSPETLGSKELVKEVMCRASERLAACRRTFPLLLSRTIKITLVFLLAAWCVVSVFLRPRCFSFWDLPLSMSAPKVARIVPGTVSVPLHSSITLGCVFRTPGGYPSCRIVMTDVADGDEQSMLLRPDSAGAFFLQRDSLTRSFTYRFTVGSTAFVPETVHVFRPPTLYSMRIRLTPPAYVGASPALLPEGQGNFSAYAGSTALFSLRTPNALSQAAFISSSRDTVALTVTGKQALGEIIVRGGCGYSFSLTDTLGQKNGPLPSFSIEQIEDALPLVQFLKPGKNKELSPALVETLWIDAMDDIGIRECALLWRTNSEQSDTAHKNSLLQRGRIEKNFRLQYVWDVRNCSLYPGDTVFYWAFARDNNPFDKTHFSTTPVFWLRIPTFEEIRQRIAQEHDAAEGSLRQAREKQDNLQGVLSNLIKSTRGKESLTWEQKQIVDDLKETFKAQSDTIKKAVNALKQEVDRLKEQGLSSREILEKMDKVREALQQIARDYGDSLLFERPPKSEKTASMQDLKEAFEKMKKMLPNLSKQLDNALKFLEMLKRDRQLAALAQLAQKYGQEQMDLAGQEKKEPKRLEEQKELTEKIDGFLKELSDKSRPNSDSGLFLREEIPSLEQAQSLHKTIQKSLRKNTAPEKNAMDRMSNGLFSLAQDLLDLQTSAIVRKIQKEKDLLMEMSYDALSIAQWQEQSANNPQSPQKTANAQQAMKQALSLSSEKLNKLSMIPPQQIIRLMKQYENASASMEQSIEALKNNMDGIDLLKDSRTRLNDLAFTLMQAAAALSGQNEQGKGGCSGMMCGMKKLSAKQAMINSATADMLQSMLGNSGKPGEEGPGGERGARGAASSEEARKQAQQAQQGIADELRKLAEKYGKESGNGLDKKAADLEEEAKRLARMLENPTPEIQDRQERFLSRMLQTTLSMHQQDDGKEERKSQSAKNSLTLVQDMSNTTIFVDRDSFFRMRQKAFSGNFPESYRNAIKSYFDSLSVLYLREK